jgi:hypothetical protein
MNERFSDRIGATQLRRQFQIDEADVPLRNALWNWACWMLKSDPRHDYWLRAAQNGMWDEFFHLRVDEVPHSTQAAVKKWWNTAIWYDAYNFVEYLLQNAGRFGSSWDAQNKPEESLNGYLERELSGYRAVKRRLVPVTSEVEVAEIERAATAIAGFEGVAEHIDTALKLLGLKPEPDKRNSIKESISAVEAAVKLLSGEKSGGIDTAVRLLEANVGLHPALKVAITKLYGYTCEGPGIRHALLESGDISFAEAKFMLVACSAFANFLIDSARPAAG